MRSRRLRRLRRLALVAAVATLLGMVSATASAAPSISVSVASWTRSEPQGLLTYDFTINSGDLTGTDSPCRSYCKYNVSGYYFDGTTYRAVHTFAQNTDWKIYPSLTLRFAAADAAVKEVTHLRAYMWNGSNQTIDSGYVQVDTPRTHSLTLSVANWARNDATGTLTYDFTVTGRNLWVESSPCKSYCQYLVALYYPDGTNKIEVHRFGSSGGWYLYRALDLRYTRTDASVPEGTMLRAYLWDGASPARTIDTGYVEVDYPRVPSVQVTVDQWERGDDGLLDYDVSVDAFNLWARTSVCAAYCKYRVEAVAADGTVVRTLFNDPYWKYRPSIHDRFTATAVTVSVATQIRVVLTNGANATLADQAGVTDHTVWSISAEDLALLVAAKLVTSPPPDVCIPLLEYGPKTRSTVSDAYIACESAVRTGNALAIARAILRYGAGAAALVALGLTTDYPTSPGSPPPPPPNPNPDPGDPGTGTGGTGGSGNPEPNPPVDLLAQIVERIAALSPERVLRIAPENREKAARQCIKHVASARIYSAGRHPCLTFPVFFPGSDVITAAQHDYDAMFTAHSPDGGAPNPGWTLLNYRPAVEQPENHKWFNQPGYDCGADTVGPSCDEYPFYASMQGGPTATPFPSLRRIVLADNTLEGSRYGTFVNQCLARTPGKAFLVVPMPWTWAPPTGAVC